MSSNCTVTRLVRCRVKDLASCFYACTRFPSEEEEADTVSSPRPSNGKVSKRSRKFEGKLGDSLQKSDSGSMIAKQGSSKKSSWPRFNEDDFIVFCFKEDGAIHVIPEKSSVATDHNEHQHANNKGEEEIEWPPDETKEISRHVEETNTNECECNITESIDSCDSKQSDATSTSSFAFPVLGWEWTGSPARMPQVEQRDRVHCFRF